MTRCGHVRIILCEKFRVENQRVSTRYGFQPPILCVITGPRRRIFLSRFYAYPCCRYCLGEITHCVTTKYTTLMKCIKIRITNISHYHNSSQWRQSVKLNNINSSIKEPATILRSIFNITQSFFDPIVNR